MNLLTDQLPPPQLGPIVVPNLFPSSSIPVSYRIAIIGEAPGKDEEYQREPFVGASGRLLNALLAQAGIVRQSVFLGNVCQVRPPSNDIYAFPWDGDEIQSGLEQLKADLEKFQPNLCILLGATPLKAFLSKTGITYWRGAVLFSDTFRLKCLPTYHPAAVLRQWEWAQVLALDLRRAASEGRDNRITEVKKCLVLPSDKRSHYAYLCYQFYHRGLTEVSIDIEGGVYGISCISFARSKDESFIVPFTNADGSSYWEEDEECHLWELISKCLADAKTRKILQNSLYDNFVLSYSYKCPIVNVSDDTMLKHWEAYCELPKGLGFLASIYTNQPPWKAERETPNLENFWRYCCTDSAVTYEISQRLDSELSNSPTSLALSGSSASLAHYKFNLALLSPILYMELRGIRYDKAEAKKRVVALELESYALQYTLDYASGYGVCLLSKEDLFAALAQYCKKKGAYTNFSSFRNNWLKKKKQGTEDWFTVNQDRIIDLANRFDSLSNEEKGELSILAYLHLNVEAPDTLGDYLYDKLKLPEQKNRKTGSRTTDYPALLALAKKTNNPVLHNIISIRGLNTRRSMLEINSDRDGRIRCGYNVVGTETGRLTCYTSPTGSGYNLQTIPKIDRDLFLADEGHYLFQCDLSGADAWTVAAHCARLGDPTMLDDLRYGIKIAKVVAAMFLDGPEISRLPRAELKQLTSKINSENPIYFGSKCCQHGTNYGMGKVLLSQTIFVQSEGAVNISAADAERLQNLYLLRYYGVPLWHRWADKILRSSGKLVSASGHTRIFFGRRDEHDTLKQFLAHEPQANTTYATNLAALRLWTDPKNRWGYWTSDRGVNSTSIQFGERLQRTRDLHEGIRGVLEGKTEESWHERLQSLAATKHSDSLIIEPLHQVHDALLGQFPREVAEWAALRIREHFNNTLQIAGQDIVIPFEGGYGESWGKLEVGKI